MIFIVYITATKLTIIRWLCGCYKTYYYDTISMSKLIKIKIEWRMYMPKDNPYVIREDGSRIIKDGDGSKLLNPKPTPPPPPKK